MAFSVRWAQLSGSAGSWRSPTGHRAPHLRPETSPPAALGDSKGTFTLLLGGAGAASTSLFLLPRKNEDKKKPYGIDESVTGLGPHRDCTQFHRECEVFASDILDCLCSADSSSGDTIDSVRN